MDSRNRSNAIPSDIVSLEISDCHNQTAEPAPPSFCDWSHDRIMCWSPTPPNTTAVQSCFAYLNGIPYDTSQNVTRECGENGVWANYTDYSRCRELPTLSAELENKLNHIENTALIYLGGYSASLVTLVVAVGIFLYFKELWCLRNAIHGNLFMSYILTSCMWILNYLLQMVVSVPVCTTMVIFLHYFQLTSFFWMFVEGLYLYNLVVQTFARDSLKLFGYLFIGWGLPGVVTLIWSIAQIFIKSERIPSKIIKISSIDDPRIDDSVFPGELMKEHACYWLNWSTTSQWIFITPTLVVLGINTIFLIRIMRVLVTKLQCTANPETAKHRKAMKALLVLTPLFGFTYVLFLWGPDHSGSSVLDHWYYEEFRTTLLSSQGFIVGLLYCFFNGEVRKVISHRYKRWEDARNVGRRMYQKCGFENGVDEPRRGKRESTTSDLTTMTTVGSRVSSASVTAKNHIEP